MKLTVLKESHRREALEVGWRLLLLKGDCMYACQEDCGMEVLVVAVNA